MIQLHITLYQDDADNDRFKAIAVDDQGDLVDVTDEYELVACATEDGRVGFMCVAKVGS